MAEKLSDDDLLDTLRGIETLRNRLAAVDARLVAELESRGLAVSLGCSSTARLLTCLLRIHPGQARVRVRLARDLVGSTSTSGTPVAPPLRATAASLVAGAISAEHAAVISTAISELPDAVAAEQSDDVETLLAEQAKQLNPAQLRLAARRLHDTLDPDGLLTTEADRHRRRELIVTQRADGSARLRGELDAVTAEATLTVLDPLSQPLPADLDGDPDRRTFTQRRHDGLRTALLTLLRSGALPPSNGVSATILLTMTPDQLTGTSSRSSGLVTAGHGSMWTAQQARSLVGDAQLIPITLTKQREITAYGDTHRIFTQNQRLAMIARDHGCSFPGCVIPAAWCQAHHVTDFAETQRTTVADGTLLCGFHHREHARLGWACVMVQGAPHWRPPPWIDPRQALRRNTSHLPADEIDDG